MTYLKFKLIWGKLNMFKKLTTFLTLAFLAACSDGVDRSNYNETPAAPAPTPMPTPAPTPAPPPAPPPAAPPAGGRSAGGKACCARAAASPPREKATAPFPRSEAHGSLCHWPDTVEGKPHCAYFGKKNKNQKRITTLLMDYNI